MALEAVSRMVAGIHASWTQIICADHECLAALAAAATAEVAARGPAAIPRAGGAPSELEALKHFSVSDCRVVIVGQGVYPDAPTLGSILGAALCSEAARTSEEHGASSRFCTSSTDLRFWAAQGVLMLDMGETGLAKEWSPFTRRLVAILAATPRTTPLHVMLWGDAARRVAPLAAAGVRTILHEWSHPAPHTDELREQFRRCDHFRTVNAMLASNGQAAIEWLESPVIIATDGSCTANGQKDARAGYGVCCATGALRGLRVSGPVAPYEYALVDPTRPAAGFRACPHAAVPPSNNRGEYLAVCYALLALLRSGGTAPIILASDSELVIKTLSLWLPARKAKGTAHMLKNYDLLQIADALYAALRAQSTKFMFQHVRSHKAAPAPNTPQYVMWAVNDLADRLAAQGRDGAHSVSPPYWLPA